MIHRRGEGKCFTIFDKERRSKSRARPTYRSSSGEKEKGLRAPQGTKEKRKKKELVTAKGGSEGGGSSVPISPRLEKKQSGT